MPNRVKEIRLRDEDMLRRAGFDPSSTGSGFANFLLLIAELYNQPGSRLHARLALEYWWPSGELAGMGLTAGANLTGPLGSEFLPGLRGLPSRSPSKAAAVQGRTNEADNIRQASLFRFVRSAGDMVTTPCLFLPYVRMLHGLVGCRNAAGLCFSLLKANVNNPGRGASLTSWDHFFGSFRQYLDHMRQPVSQPVPKTSYRMTLPSVTNQLYPHLYQSSVHLHSGRLPASNTTMDMQTLPGTGTGLLNSGAWASSHATAPAILPRAIQPEEQQGLQAVLRLISRIARMDPVARSLFAGTTHWHVIPTCIGLLGCPISLGLKADLLHLLTALSRTATVGALIWRHISMSETEMDEVEPRAEEYPITRAFLALTTVFMPQLTGTVADNGINAVPLGRSMVPDGTLLPSDDSLLSQSNSLISVITFLTNSVFLKHNMRAYRDPNERWDIAAACLVLFDGCVEQFLNRLDAAASVVLNTPVSGSKLTTDASGPGSRFDETTHSFDWASALLSGVTEVDTEPATTQSRLRSQPSSVSSTSSTAALLSQLRLPPGWPYSDPGFYLAVQLLSDSALFRTLTGLLEVGLHRMLEFPIPDGPPVGMVHATGAGIRLIRRLLAQEEILYTFVRRTTVNPSFGSLNRSSSFVLPGASGLNATVLNLSVPTVVVHQCTHRARGSAFHAVTTSRRELLGIFAGMIKWTTQCDVDDLTTETNTEDDVDGATVALTVRGRRANDVDCFATFTDEWLYSGHGITEGTDWVNWATGTSQKAHPAAQTARICIGLPRYPSHWVFPGQEWELWATWPETQASILAPVVRSGSVLSHFHASGKFNAATNGNWLYSYVLKGRPVSLCTGLLHVLLAALDHPSPNLAHWLLGFRLESAQAVARTTLQDAGIGDQPRTCLHAMLDVVDMTTRSDCFLSHGSAEPTHFMLTVHWNLTLIWQILHRLSANPLSSESLLRFLRSNHDLLAKHVQLNLIAGSVEPQAMMKPEIKASATGCLLELLSLNRINWMLRILAMEIRKAATGNHCSYAVKLLKLFWGGAHLICFSVQSNAIALLHRLKLYASMNGPEAFDLRALDAWVVDELITDCELGCPLLQSESMATRKASTLIDPMIFFNRVYAKLLATRLPSGGATSVDDVAALFAWAAREQTGRIAQLPDYGINSNSGTDREQMIALAQDLVQLGRWIESRNDHRLTLGAGKQAALEAWRQVVEISLGLLVSPTSGAPLMYALTQSTSSTMLLSMTSELNGTLGGVEEIRFGGASSTTGLRPRAPQLISLDVVGKLLSQLCETDQTPSSLRLLASGTSLNLASFACTELSVAANKRGPQLNDTEQMMIDMGRFSSLMIPVVRLLTTAIMRTTRIDSPKEDISQALRLTSTECLNAMTQAANTGELHWSHSDAFNNGVDTIADGVPMLSLLCWDLSRGHAVTQMAAMTVLELLIGIDRSSADFVTFLSAQGTLQHLVDSIPMDLATVESFLLSAIQPSPLDEEGLGSGDQAAVSTDADSVSAATSAFHMFRTKMSLLCRAATTLPGAKRITQSNLLPCLSSCGIFSAFTVASCYAHGLDSLYACEDLDGTGPHKRNHETSTVAWTRLHYLLSSCVDEIRTDESSVLQHIVRLISLSDSADSLSTDGSEITWSSVLLPAVRLLKSLLITMGKR
ncbi:unnamed protein product [Echinostoma caproni]|uniref:Mediator of RNA polymerase II transcription subunit 33A n=1 Tax=Echinostoma caproni TaxID=27848 RepID=A0A183AHI7_9TREM|nr:unnamed protein product [Echinostoma caproni]